MNALTSFVVSPLTDRLTRQRQAFLTEGAPSLQQRRANLSKLKRSIVARKAEIEAALKADFGHRSTHETAIMEMMTVVQGINYLNHNLRRWMRPTRRHVAMHFQPARSYIVYQPLGVIGIMAPWNYPLALALMPLATALAAGNRAMIKPSEFTPATSALLQIILAELFAPEQVAVIQGEAAVGAEFAALPFDHLVFTGSTPIGRAVMKAAAENLVPVTLELGGKSPVVIERGHGAASAASIAYGKLANAGQTCVAPDYVLLHESDAEPFLAAFDVAAKRLYPNGPLSDDYTSIVNQRHYQRLVALLDDARVNGARIIEMGHRPQDAGTRPHTLAPTVVLGVTDDMRIMQEEIFGPLLPVRTYANIDQAIGYINAHPRPLALYYFGPTGRSRDKVLTQTTSGNVTINNTIMHYAQDDLPFGGVGPSGMGAYHGVEGFRALSHAKGVLIQSRRNLGNLLQPPFGWMANLILKTMLR
ncbi:coniferyl aldehyde dehydrogenase [Rudaea cellulosilytica]|uniref:coniferyl aldehyde dehydrogenase n=1 Tax=Rudaea cellulosilytica TaxID=540746 RepID=UPI00037E98D7|nr:coniferyl aldehyde dehydrogenase [Rudaea cellulosilytica]